MSRTALFLSAFRGALRACLAILLLSGCAASRPLAPFPAGSSGPVSNGVADVLIPAVNQTRASGREVGGWCWSDARTGELTGVVRGGIGDQAGIGIELPVGRRGGQRVSCSWHTHAWDPRVIPGPSRRDLANSRLPQLRGMAHFVLDRQGIWQYADGRVRVMCPWNGAGTNFDAARCRS